MPDLDLVTAKSPLRVFSLLHDARPVLLNLGAPGGFDITGQIGFSSSTRHMSVVSLLEVAPTSLFAHTRPLEYSHRLSGSYDEVGLLGAASGRASGGGWQHAPAGCFWPLTTDQVRKAQES